MKNNVLIPTNKAESPAGFVSHYEYYTEGKIQWLPKGQHYKRGL